MTEEIDQGPGGSEAAQAVLRKARKSKQELLDEALGRLIAGRASEDFARVVRWLLSGELCGLLGPTLFATDAGIGGVDVPRTMWREGRRSVGIDLLKKLHQIDKDLYTEIMRLEADDIREAESLKDEAQRAQENARGE